MSFNHHHLALSTHGQTTHLLEMQLVLLNGLRQTLSLIEHPQANEIYHNVWKQANECISRAHAEYILGRGPKAIAMVEYEKLKDPEKNVQEIFAQIVQPKLPKYQPADPDENLKDRSTNRHWATMVRVGFGADEQNRWNHQILDQWFDEGKIQTLKDFVEDRDAVNKAGACLLRVDTTDGGHVYCVRVVTEQFNRNVLTLTETVPIIDAAVLVDLEGIWATHDDYGLIDDAELEGYISDLLEHYGVKDTPLPMVVQQEGNTIDPKTDINYIPTEDAANESDE